MRILVWDKTREKEKKTEIEETAKKWAKRKEDWQTEKKERARKRLGK